MKDYKLLYCLPKNSHSPKAVENALREHPEVKFVSLVAIDVFGHDTDEKIPISVMLSDVEGFLTKGVQTDGSSVFLPLIADISNARVDIFPDADVNWYVEYNYQNIDDYGRPVGTLRIPAFLVHNNTNQVGSRIILKDAIKAFKDGLKKDLAAHPEFVKENLGIESAEDIVDFSLTAATELEFYVKTPHEAADKERLVASQEMKEQYWKRTIGPVRTAMEKTIEALEAYGLEVEMGHKEVGGVKAEMVQGGNYSHIMEQLEIDWKYSDPMQAADNDRQVRYIVRDVFRECGLEVTFMAKPVGGVAGSGKHVHMGVVAVLKDGRKVNLFASLKDNSYLSPVGYGALMGLMKNYEIIAPFCAANNDAFNRLKPGFEAPVCVATSLGQSAENATRNRTVLVGLVRVSDNPMATHFELRSPCPKSNTHLVLASSLLAMLDGIENVLDNERGEVELLAAVSKTVGEHDIYLEDDRIYRAENDIFNDYTEEQRNQFFGKAPATVWECVNAFNRYPEKTKLLFRDNAMSPLDLESYKVSVVTLWASELRERIITNMKEFIRKCRKAENTDICSLDEKRWEKINELRKSLMQDTEERQSKLSELAEALDKEDYDKASDLQLYLSAKMDELEKMYREYEHNLM